MPDRTIETIGPGSVNEEDLEDLIVKIPKGKPATVFVIHASWGDLAKIADSLWKKVKKAIVWGFILLLVLTLIFVFIAHVLGISCTPNELIPGLWNGECYDGDAMAGM